MDQNQVIAIAGAGAMAKYVVEELERDGRYGIAVISRAERQWFLRPSVDFHVTDYSAESLTSILNKTHATVLLSFVHDNGEFYVNSHANMIAACRASVACRRFIPSEYGGDITNHPDKPRFYIPTHGAVRQLLRQQDEVEWTLVNHGWFMDYFVPMESTWFEAFPYSWPILLDKWEAVDVPGTGDETIGWTSARDVAKAVIKLFELEEWPEKTYVQGEQGTWNQAIGWMEEFHGRKMGKVTHRPAEESMADILSLESDGQNTERLWKAYMEEWNFSGASATPHKEVERQRERMFEGVQFQTVKELLERWKTG